MARLPFVRLTMEAEMSSSKQPKTRVPTDADLKGNPGIGASKGTTMSGEDPDVIAADSTFEGDVESETTAGGRRSRSCGPHEQIGRLIRGGLTPA